MLFKLLLFPLFFCLNLSGFNINYEIEVENFNKDIENMVEEIAGDYKNNIAIYYCRLDGSKEYYLNNDKRFIAASLTKVPQAMEVIDKVNKGEINLYDVIEYCEEDYEEGTGILKYNEEIGGVTVREALELSLRYSDNIANNMLNRVCGYDINEYISRLTGEDITVGNLTTAREQLELSLRYSDNIANNMLNRVCGYDINEYISRLTGEDITVGNLTTAREQGEIYYNLYSDEKYSLIIDLLKESYCHDRIDKYLEREIIAHKFGNYYRYFHDGGIIYEKNPYILVVLTKDIGKLSENLEGVECGEEIPLIDGGEEAKELIAKISKAINSYNIIKTKNMVK